MLGRIPVTPNRVLLFFLIVAQGGSLEPAPHDAENQTLGPPLGPEIACPLSFMHMQPATLISPSQDDPRPAVLKEAASLIYRLPDSVIKKVIPVTASSSPEQARRRLLRELSSTSALALHRHFPRVIAVDLEESAIYMEDAGRPLTRDSVPCDWRRQILAILHILRHHHIFHNDWLGLGWPDSSPNLCVRSGTLSLIDFTWATHGAEHYPFMNPTEALVYEAHDLWDLLQRTRDLQETRRLRYQNVRDLYRQRNAQALESKTRIRPTLALHRVMERVGDIMALEELAGSSLPLQEVADNGLRVLVNAQNLHPWCFVHCEACQLIVTLNRNEPISSKRVCDCGEGAGINCQLVVSVWGLEEGRHTLEARAEGFIGEGGDEAWWEESEETTSETIGDPRDGRDFAEATRVEFDVDR